MINYKNSAFDLKLINEKRPHILDAETEKLLTEAQDALSTPSMYTVCLATLI
ncbi:Oligoendopeptidase F [Staphylococcus aureus]|uniref:Oligoendopeptidase F n=1 Tax=Staphylococcus aureus TaxID=1280 RepID=A0A380EI10_STAAU|nr:Oligoendopeptidase F [Staphylococcus aureus]